MEIYEGIIVRNGKFLKRFETIPVDDQHAEEMKTCGWGNHIHEFSKESFGLVPCDGGEPCGPFLKSDPELRIGDEIHFPIKRTVQRIQKDGSRKAVEEYDGVWPVKIVGPKTEFYDSEFTHEDATAMHDMLLKIAVSGVADTEAISRLLHQVDES